MANIVVPKDGFENFGEFERLNPGIAEKMQSELRGYRSPPTHPTPPTPSFADKLSEIPKDELQNMSRDQILERIGIDTNTFSPPPGSAQVSPVNRENPNPSIGNTNFSLRFVGVSTVPKEQLGDVMTRFEEEGGSTGELKWE